MAVLSGQDIKHLINQDSPLVEGWVDLEAQLQVNSFDLTLREVAIPQSAGKITVANNQRIISELAPLMFDGLDSMELVPGTYIITYNEIVHLPKNIMALATPRSSLLRCGVTVHTAVWDAGYSGRSQSLMVVYNPRGFRLQRNARLIQLVLGFLYMEGIIADQQEVASLRVCEDEPIADVRLLKSEYEAAPRRTITSGCGSGISSDTSAPKVVSDLVVTPEEILSLMHQLYQHQDLFRKRSWCW